MQIVMKPLEGSYLIVLQGASAQRRVSALRDQLGGVLGVPLEDVVEIPLTDSIERELRNLDRNKDVRCSNGRLVSSLSLT